MNIRCLFGHAPGAWESGVPRWGLAPEPDPDVSTYWVDRDLVALANMAVADTLRCRRCGRVLARTRDLTYPALVKMMRGRPGIVELDCAHD